MSVAETSGSNNPVDVLESAEPTLHAVSELDIVLAQMEAVITNREAVKLLDVFRYQGAITAAKRVSRAPDITLQKANTAITDFYRMTDPEFRSKVYAELDKLENPATDITPDQSELVPERPTTLSTIPETAIDSDKALCQNGPDTTNHAKADETQPVGIADESGTEEIDANTPPASSETGKGDEINEATERRRQEEDLAWAELEKSRPKPGTGRRNKNPSETATIAETREGTSMLRASSAAAYLGVNESTLNALVGDGQISCFVDSSGNRLFYGSELAGLFGKSLAATQSPNGSSSPHDSTPRKPQVKEAPSLTPKVPPGSMIEKALRNYGEVQDLNKAARPVAKRPENTQQPANRPTQDTRTRQVRTSSRPAPSQNPNTDNASPSTRTSGWRAELEAMKGRHGLQEPTHLNGQENSTPQSDGNEFRIQYTNSWNSFLANPSHRAVDPGIRTNFQLSIAQEIYGRLLIDRGSISTKRLMDMADAIEAAKKHLLERAERLGPKDKSLYPKISVKKSRT